MCPWVVSASAFLSFESGWLPEDLPEEKTNTYLLTYLPTRDSFDIVDQILLVVCVIGIVRVDCSAAPLVQGVWGGVELRPQKHET